MTTEIGFPFWWNDKWVNAKFIIEGEDTAFDFYINGEEVNINWDGYYSHDDENTPALSIA